MIPDPLYILLKSGEYATAKAVATITDVSITDYYDGETYRNDTSISRIGQAWSENVILGGGTSGAADLDDQAQAVPPWPKQKTRVERQFLNGGGDIVARCWLDEFRLYSDTIPKSIA